MQGMLKMDPGERSSVFECLTHSYFDELRLHDQDFLKIMEDDQTIEVPTTIPLATRPIQSS
jgi:hypothetical protein